MEINANVAPYVPPGFSVERNCENGRVNVADIGVYLPEKQKKGLIDFKEALNDAQSQSQPLLNATVLEALLKNPEFIPNDWKGKFIIFAGTLYRTQRGNIFVRCLHFRNGSWEAPLIFWDKYNLSSLNLFAVLQVA